SGGNLEHHRPERESRVREEHLLDVEPGTHLEEGIDAPDERHRQVKETRDGEIGPDDRARAHPTPPNTTTTGGLVQALDAGAGRITAPPIKIGRAHRSTPGT